MKKYRSLVAALLAIMLFQSSYQDTVHADEGNHNIPANIRDERELIGNIVALADAIANAVPTVPTTPDPTQYPTESPKPSPSPSEYPTSTPTISPKPTSEPTQNPTESPKPSPSPSEFPTEEPTMKPSIAPSTSPTITPAPTVTPSLAPTQTPSAQPSGEPSSIPTTSAAPSDLPSDLPSLSPSMHPTVSTVPSVAPTAIPTISIAPSDLPSLVPSAVPTSSPSISMAPTPFFTVELRQTIVLTFDELQREMSNNVTILFELTTEEFLQRNLPVVPGGSVTLSSVRVLSQSVVRAMALTTTPKEQKGGNRQLQASGLEVLLEVTGVYESWVPDEQFDFENHIFKTFEENWPLYKNVLLESSQFFTPLIAQSYTRNNDPSPSIKDEREITNIGSYIAVCLFAFVSVTLGLFVSLYALRHYRNIKSSDEEYFEKEYGKELDFERPVPSYLTSSSMESASEKIVPIARKPIPQQKTMQVTTASNQIIKTSQSGACLDACTTPSHMSPTNNSNGILNAMSPNTMEIGRGIMEGRNFKKDSSAPSNVGGLASTIMCQMGGFSSNSSQQDPPDRNSSSHYKGEPSGQRVRQLDPTTQNMDDDRETTVSNALRGSNIFKLSRDPSVVGVKFPYDDPGSEISRDPVASSQNGGRLGATDIHSSYHRKVFDPSTPQSSTYSSSLNAFLNMVGGSIGTRPVASPQRQMQNQQSLSQNQPQRQPQHQPNEYSYQQSEASMGVGGDVYDVFAPSGALGIVVDTTRDGPAVHSLKQNSPMLGLINPGDLIVGLDDEDTRNMTAATLTRLMARKSHQHERKITLLTAENY